jgi:hypothetical protein
MVPPVVGERERQPEQRVEAVPAPGVSAPLDALQRARNSEGDERLELAGRLNALLRRRASDAEREEWAQFLLEKLDDEAFHDLYDSDGVSCRAVAVDAVLSLGFPWALHLEPDDLEYLRTVRPSRLPSSGWRAMAVVTGVLAALFALAVFLHL